MVARKTTNPRDERIAALEKQVSELVDAIVKLAQERPTYVPCLRPHYPAAPVIPYYPPWTVPPNITWSGTYQTSGSGSYVSGGCTSDVPTVLTVTAKS